MRPFILLASLAYGGLTTSCASSHQTSTAVSPQIEMPLAASRPCRLLRLPEAPTLADLEIGYAQRGADLVACDAARRLAVDTHAAEHALEARHSAGRVGRGATPP